MMIVDLQQVMISNLMSQLGAHTNVEVDRDLLRHMVLNSLRGYNMKFKEKYGEMVIACDAQRSWRKEVFPYYKANRKKSREESELDWPSIFESLNAIREELKEFFPYRVIHIDGAEADDVIGTLCHEFGDTNTPILVVSGDKDFRQLQKFMNVRQYDPVQKKWLEEKDPSRYLKEHIIRGDIGDGVPNALSADNCLVLKIRQKSVFQKNLDVWLDQEPEEFMPEADDIRRYRRNELLIDLSKTPEEIGANIMVSFKEQAGKNRSKLFNYFIANRLKNLMTDIDSF